MINIVISGLQDKFNVAQASKRLVRFIKKHANIIATDSDMTLDLESCDADMVIVLGGDGSILGAVRRMGRRQVPVVGINFGKFGFLASFSEKEFCIEFPEIARNKGIVSKRLMLLCKHVRNGKVLKAIPATNEIVISHTMPRMIDLRLYMDNQALTTFSGDGVIVATATGSTGYSLSAGGPILDPGIESFLVAPICPHTLTSRPLVFSADNVVEIELLSKDKRTALTVDGQIDYRMRTGDRVMVEKFNQHFQIVQPTNANFFETLRRKLNWGGQINYASH